MQKISYYLVILAAISLLQITPCAAADPMAKVQLTVDSVISLLKDQALDTESRRDKLSAIIANAFNFEAMAQRILARNWKKAAPQERERFIALLESLLRQSYLGHIENYTDEKVAYVKQRIKNKNAAIDTLIITDSKEIPVSYRLLLSQEEWKVYDVVIESVSFVNNYRSTYGQLIKKNGFDGLLTKMEEKLAQLKQE